MIYLLKTLSVVLLLSVSALEVEIVRGARTIAKQDPGAKLSPVRRSTRHTRSASACFNNPVGVSSTSIILDSQMTASSQWGVGCLAAYGRLEGVRGIGWCAKTSSRNDDWLQVDLGESIQACGLATQGEANGGDEWVTAFKLSYSSDGKSWKTYQENNGKELEFHRKGKSNGIDRHKLPVPVFARFFRFNPTQRYKWNCLRVEIYTTFPFACYNNPVGVSSTSIIPDSQMTASSQYSVRYQSAYGRLQGVRGGGWCSLSAIKNDEWLQVDLGESIQACGVATQGEANEVKKWVTAFKLSYSSDGKSWKTCKDKNGKELEFHRKGKSDGIDRHKLPVPVSARFIRFNPTQRHHHNCLRVEIYTTLPFVSQTVCRNFSVSRNFSITAVAHCKSLIKSPRQNFYKLDATTAQKGLMCRVLTQSIGVSLVYIVSAELLNQAGWQGINSGHLGLLFNAVDEHNFDFVYFRPHSASSCYQTGYMAKGNLNLVESKACPKGPPKGGVWSPVSVKVHGQDVQVYLSGDLVATVKSHFPPRARGGVLTFRGYKNVVLFRKFQITPQMYISKRCGKVVEFPDKVKLLKLVADHGAWPQDSFCQVAYLKDAGKSRNYQLSVDLFNFIGQGRANYGHPGVFFNAEDEDNYDFVYFRPHSVNGCYQTGYVYKGQPKFDGAKTSTCPSGPPKGAQWFHVKVTVSTATPAGEVKVYLNGKLLTSWNPRYPIKNRGGVLVANGYKNVVYYKNFHIQ